MKLIYKKAAIEDIDLLTEMRIEVLRAANQLSSDTDMDDVKRQSYSYYNRALRDNTYIAYLVFDKNRCVGTGGVSFYQVMPTYHNPTGNKAYIMNMYTNPDYRRKGIAYGMLEILVKHAKEKGITDILLEATAMGCPLYKKYGFVRLEDEMRLPG